MKTRKQIANEEATRDPIFLLQRRRILSTGWLPHGFHWCEDCEGLYNETPADHKARHNLEDYDDPGLSGDEMIWNQCAVESWDTEKVFLTREGGEKYGNAKKHHYPDGWRVYCVNAEGALAHALLQLEEE